MLLETINIQNIYFRLTGYLILQWTLWIGSDRQRYVRFGLRMVLEYWDREFLGTTTIFQKSNISWPQQPPLEGASDISEKLDFLLIYST